MRLLYLLLLAAALNLVRAASKSKKEEETDWTLATTHCDLKPHAKVLEECCARPRAKHYTVKLVTPVNATCIETASLELPMSFMVKEEPAESNKTLDRPGFFVALFANKGQGLQNGIGFLGATCVGAEVDVIHQYSAPLDQAIDVIRPNSSTSWSFVMFKLNKPGEDYAIIDSHGVGEREGFWLVDDCDELKKEMCEGLIEPKPTENRFYQATMKDCPKAGTGAPSGGGAGGSPAGDGNTGPGTKHGQDVGTKSKGGGAKCSKKPHPHTSGHHSPKEEC